VFRDILFPDRISQNATFTYASNVTIAESDSGIEQRIRRGALRWECEYSLQHASRTEIDAIRSIYETTGGTLYSFRCRNWADYLAGYVHNTVHGSGVLYDPSTPVQIGVGNGTATAFQLTKTSTIGSFSYTRVITKPRNDTTYPVQIFLNGVLQTSGFTVNYSTGIVTFSSPPAGAVTVAWRGLFDMTFRFDNDLSMNLRHDRIGNSRVKLKEVIRS